MQLPQHIIDLVGSLYDQGLDDETICFAALQAYNSAKESYLYTRNHRTRNMTLVKQRKEAAEQYVAAGRQELADNELSEAAVMEKYLPKQLSEAEVEAKIKDIIAQVGATSIKDMGKVMGTANKALAGLSDGRTISTIVKKLLS